MTATPSSRPPLTRPSRPPADGPSPPPAPAGARHEDRGAVRVVFMDRPPTNALDRGLLLALEGEVRAAAAEPGLRALVVASAVPGTFSSGLDLDWIYDARSPARTARGTVTLARLSRRLALALERCRLPSVAAVSGVAVGSGVTLALACDLRVASELCCFWLPDVVYGGFLGDSGLGRLVRLLGPGAARELLLTGQRVGAERALALGLVNRAAPRDGVLAAALDLAEILARGAPVSIALARRAVDGVGRRSAWAWARELRREARGVKTAAWTQDAFEGLEAHFGGRPPQFKGR